MGREWASPAPQRTTQFRSPAKRAAEPEPESIGLLVLTGRDLWSREEGMVLETGDEVPEGMGRLVQFGERRHSD